MPWLGRKTQHTPLWLQYPWNKQREYVHLYRPLVVRKLYTMRRLDATTLTTNHTLILPSLLRNVFAPFHTHDTTLKLLSRSCGRGCHYAAGSHTRLRSSPFLYIEFTVALFFPSAHALTLAIPRVRCVHFLRHRVRASVPSCVIDPSFCSFAIVLCHGLSKLYKMYDTVTQV